jgi:lipid II:glycine glycyltransferase (peptidoglycan interpeptide bridge formation enzyme)
MQSAYGYGGPVAFDANSKSLQTFADEHARWVARHNIVAEFVRFNPFGQHDEFSSIVTPELNRNTVSIELEPDFSVILDKASSARRRNYTKAVKSGLNFCIDTNYSDFIAIYRQAMQRLDADQYYYFSAEYFAALAKMPEKQRFFTRVTDNSGRLLAAGIFLLDELAAHYHLGGSQLDARALQPDAFMLFSAAKYAAEAGKKTLHLGGGLSLAEDDGLFRFKAGFSAQRHRFYIGKKIHQPKQYAEFSQKWQKITGQPATILLHYHEGLANANL